MTDTELVAQTAANGERCFGVYDYDKLRWNVLPRMIVCDVGDGKKN